MKQAFLSGMCPLLTSVFSKLLAEMITCMKQKYGYMKGYNSWSSGYSWLHE